MPDAYATWHVSLQWIKLAVAHSYLCTRPCTNTHCPCPQKLVDYFEYLIVYTYVRALKWFNSSIAIFTPKYWLIVSRWLCHFIIQEPEFIFVEPDLVIRFFFVFLWWCYISTACMPKHALWWLLLCFTMREFVGIVFLSLVSERFCCVQIGLFQARGSAGLCCNMWRSLSWFKHCYPGNCMWVVEPVRCSRYCWHWGKVLTFPLGIFKWK